MTPEVHLNSNQPVAPESWPIPGLASMWQGGGGPTRGGEGAANEGAIAERVPAAFPDEGTRAGLLFECRWPNALSALLAAMAGGAEAVRLHA